MALRAILLPPPPPNTPPHPTHPPPPPHPSHHPPPTPPTQPRPQRHSHRPTHPLLRPRPKHRTYRHSHNQRHPPLRLCHRPARARLSSRAASPTPLPHPSRSLLQSHHPHHVCPTPTETPPTRKLPPTRSPPRLPTNLPRKTLQPLPFGQARSLLSIQFYTSNTFPTQNTPGRILDYITNKIHFNPLAPSAKAPNQA